MKISEENIGFLKKRFGHCRYAYVNSDGVWSIGYGHTATAKKGMVLPNDRHQTEATKLLISDLESIENYLNENLKVEVNQNQFDALVILGHTIGLGALAESEAIARTNQGYPAEEIFETENGDWASRERQQRLEEIQIFNQPEKNDASET